MFLLPLAVAAQRYDIKTYSIKEGLPQQQVAGVSQDQHGYMWFGTYGEGLARFDGQEYRQVTTRQGLRDNMVYELYHDAGERFWVSTESGGLARVFEDTVRYRFTEHPIDTLVVNRLTEAPGGQLMMGTYGGGLYMWDGDSLSVLTTERGLASDIVWDVYQRDPQSRWIATHSGVTVMEEGAERSRLLEGTGGLAVYRIFEKEGGEIWLATHDGLRIWNGESLETIRIINGQELGYVYDIAEDMNGNVWVATASNGLFRWDGERYDHLTEDNGLSSNYMYELYRDRDGYLWAATDENGVNLVRSNAFLRYTGEVNPLLSVVNAVFRSREGDLWVGTDRGLGLLDNGIFEWAGGEILEPVWEITQRPDGSLLLLMEDNTILAYDGRRFTDFTEEQRLEKSHTLDIMSDSRGRLWIARQDGLVFHRAGESRVFTTEDGLPSLTIWDLYEDGSGNIWLGTDDGLARYTGAEGESFHVYDTGDGLAHNRISHITTGPEGHLWLGTAEGVTRMTVPSDSSGASFLNLGDLHETHRDESQFIAFDSEGYLWQGTSAGIHRIDVERYREGDSTRIRHYGFEALGEGLETSHQAIGTDRRGRLWMGTVDGLVMYDPERAFGRTLRPRVHITAFETHSGVFGHTGPGVKKSASLEGARRMSYDEDDLVVHFNAVDFLNPEQLTYSYRLLGYSERWSPPSKTRHAIFTNLPPGDYRFEIRARNSHGNWSAEAAGLDFHIATPFWQSWWFRALVLLAAIGFVYGFARLRVSYLERNKLRELVDRKTQDLQDALREKEVLVKEVHHRVKNNLAVISSLLQMQIWESEDGPTRQVLQDSQLRIQSISLVHEKLYQSDNMAQVNFREYVEELLEAIERTYEEAGNHIRIETDITNVEMTVNLAIPTSLILNELVTNAYKHAFNGREEGRIRVQVDRTGSGMVLEVRDNGAGLPDDFGEGQDSSLGMSLVSTLTKQLSGEIEAYTEEGAVFRITYPYQN